MPYHINEELSDVIFEVDGDKVSFKVPIPASGIGEDELWNLLSKPGTEQIDISHIKDALSSYVKGDSFFEEDENGNIRVKDGKTLYTEGGLSAKGLSTEEGGGGTGGAYYLSDLLDVSLISLVTDDMLKWDGNKWVNIPMSTITPDLSWGNITDKPSWIGDTKPSYTFAEITNKPTTLAGYGITDAYTATQTDSLLDNKLDASVFDELFEKVEISTGVYAIRAKYGIYTDYFLSAKGYTDSESGGTGGATSLGQLVNVGSWADEVPSYDRVMVQLAGQTKWTEKKLSDIGGGLDESQLEQYLTTNNYAKKSDIPSLTGYATITDVDDRIDDLINGAPAAYDTLKEIADVLQGNVDSIGDILTVLGTKADKATTLAGYGITDAYTKLEVNSLLDSKLDASVFNDLFEKVKLEDGTFAIRAKYGFYTESFLSGKGLAPGEEGGGGASNLSDLLDVNLTDLTTDDMLKWDGNKWVNIPMSTITPDLSWGSITGKPTTIAGYGITDAYTKTDSDSRYVNVSGDYMTGQLNLQVNGSVPLNINNTNENQESCLRVQSGGVSKSAFGWANVYGTYMYDYTSKKYLYILNGILRYDGNKIWHAGNGGAGSGLDADLLDGLQWSSFNLERLYTINASSLDNTKFYPIFFRSDINNLLLEIRSPGAIGTEAYNMNRFRAIIHSNGWDDSGESLVMLNRYNYDNNEITIGAIGYGIRQGGIAVWVRGGLTYTLKCNYTPSLKTSDYTFYDEVYTVGTNYYGGNNTNVDIIWLNNTDRAKYDVATISSNVASATKLQTPRTIWGQNFDGTKNVSGTLTGVTSITASGSITTTSSTNPFYANVAAGSWAYLRLKSGTPLWDIAVKDTNLSSSLCFRYNGVGDTMYLSTTGILATTGNIKVGSGVELGTNGWLQTNKSGTGLYNLAEDARWFANSNGWNTDKSIVPTNNSKYLGNSSLRWYAVYANAGNFSGAVKMSSTLNVSGVSTISNSSSPTTSSTDAALQITAGGLYVKKVIRADEGIWTNGYLSAKGQNTSSDMRLKDVLSDIDLPVKQIAKAPAFKFAWKDSEGIDAGSSAQYWEKVLPECVREIGGYKTMAYANIALLSAISLARNFETLEQRVARLEKENEELKQKIATLLA